MCIRCLLLGLFSFRTCNGTFPQPNLGLGTFEGETSLIVYIEYMKQQPNTKSSTRFSRRVRYFYFWFLFFSNW